MTNVLSGAQPTNSFVFDFQLLINRLFKVISQSCLMQIAYFSKG